ncbi:MAG: TonB-dependent receptor, partial [Candidatus Latescibacterota bacterium]|nr:TonB-dependent receptor [Candidatus Latescibacterota bacterium]
NLGTTLVRATLGGGMRGDDVDVALWKNNGRARAGALVDSRVLERNFHMWGREEIFINAQWRLMLGLRADYFTFNVDDRLEGQPADLPHASGYAHNRVLSPKVMLAYSPRRSLDFFANAGTGFHSNDARNAIIDRRVTELQRSLAAEGRSGDEIAGELAARQFDPGHLDTGTLPRAIGAEF